MMKKTITRISLSAAIFVAYPACCNDIAKATELNINIPVNESRPNLIVDKNADSPAMRIYLEEIENKIQPKLVAIKFPPDTLGKRIYGLFKVSITLQKDGHVEEVQVWPGPETTINSNYDVFRDAITRTIKGQEPLPQFPPGVFSGNDLVTFEIEVEFTQPNDKQKGNKSNRHH